MKPLKLAHREGHTNVCYDSSGSFILTGGGDGKVCIWEGRDDTDTTTVSMGGKVYAVAFQGGRFFAATDNQIRVHTFPDGVSDGLVTRFSMDCRCFNISSDGSMLVAGADDFKVKVIALDENECTSVYSDHKAPILSVALDPTKELVASSSCDGTVKIWGLHDGSTEKSLDIQPKCNEPSQAPSLCQMCWSEDGEFLLIPVKNKINIHLRSSWEVVKTISHSGLEEAINVMSLSLDGLYLACGCINGDMAFFDWQNEKLIHMASHPKRLPITSIIWNPKKLGEVAFCDNVGQLGFLDNVLGIDQPNSDPNPPVSSDTFADDVADDDMLASTADPEAAGLDEINRILDEGDDENSIDIGSIKRSLMPMEDNEDDAVSGKVEEPLRPVVQAQPSAPPLPPPQAPFQPGSTPEHLSNRFMVWNSVGIIRQYISDEENSIDVEFHDTSTHHALHIDNKSDFTMAGLSSQAILLASQGLDDGVSKLLCMHFGSWDSHKEWTYNMPDGELIQAITVSETWVAVATSTRNLRVYSIGGIQHQVISLPGDVLTLASHQDSLLAVYHRGVGSTPGDQCLGVMLFSKVGSRGGATTRALVSEALPMSKASKMAWLGFSDEGVPFYMDVAGVVRMLDRQCWSPVANTKQHAKGKSDHYWIVSVSTRQQQIRCVPCKGSRFPATLPRPALAVLPLQLPLCDAESEKSKYEEAYLRSSMVARSSSSTDTDTSARQALVKLFAIAAKNERDFQAMEVCELMGDQSLLQLAVRYATGLRRIQLAERVGEFMHQRQEEGEGENEEEEEEDEEVSVYHTPRAYGRKDEASDEGEDEETEGKEEEPRSSSGPHLITQADRSAKSVKTDVPPSRRNPFGVASSADRKSLKGTQIFDKMEKTTPKAPVFAPLPVNLKKSGSKKATGNQTKLFGFKKDKEIKTASPSVKQESQNGREESSENQPSKKKVSAFDLWFEANKASLQEEHPELSEEDIVQKATEAFRSLSKEERTVWVQKAKSSGTASVEDATKKRKLPEDSDKLKDTEKTGADEPKRIKKEPEALKKAPLSQATNAKLAKFAKSD